jgi:septal ring factor EnvC (AmiA/AmiB activator)
MITNQDIKKLTTVFATKEDLSRVEMSLVSTQGEVGEIKKEVREIKKTTNQILNAVDGLVGTIQDLRVEDAATSGKFARHEKWIKEIAKKTKTKLVVE